MPRFKTAKEKSWGTASNSNIEIIQRFQNKYLRIIFNAPWYVNDTLNLNVQYVRDEIKRLSRRYADRMGKHPNILAIDAKIPRRLETTSRLMYIKYNL